MTTKKRKSGERLTKKELEKAKRLYLNYESISDISKKLSMSRTSVSHHINKDGGWKQERELRRAELLEKVSLSRGEDFAKMTASTITVLKRALEDLANRDTAPTVMEAKGASQILETLDKITRLDKGDPTEIIREDKPTTVVELRKRLKNDPFAGELEDAEFRESD